MKSNETLKLKMGTALMALGLALSVGSVINTAQARSLQVDIQVYLG